MHFGSRIPWEESWTNCSDAETLQTQLEARKTIKLLLKEDMETIQKSTVTVHLRAGKHTRN